MVSVVAGWGFGGMGWEWWWKRTLPRRVAREPGRVRVSWRKTGV